MRKRRLLGIPLVLAFALAAFTGGAPAAPGEGPPCANVVDFSYNFQTTTLRFEAKLAAPACIGRATYELFVQDGAAAAEATHTGFSTEGNPQFQYVASETTVCVHALTSSTKTGKEYDRAPDAGCLALTLGTSGGGAGGFN